jgi:hypothetical protein
LYFCSADGAVDGQLPKLENDNKPLICNKLIKDSVYLPVTIGNGDAILDSFVYNNNITVASVFYNSKAGVYRTRMQLNSDGVVAGINGDTIYNGNSWNTLNFTNDHLLFSYKHTTRE